MKTNKLARPRIIQDYCAVCNAFTAVARCGHMDRGVCAHCAGRLLQAFKLEYETNQLLLFASPAVRRSYLQ